MNDDLDVLDTLADHPGDGIENQPPQQDDEYKKLGGWLLLVGVGVWLNPFSIFIQNILYILNDMLPVFNDLDMPVQVLFVVEVVANFVFAGYFGYNLILYVRKKKFFPKLFIILTWAYIAFLMADSTAAEFMIKYYSPGYSIEYASIFGTLARQLAPALIWTAYMLKSERVKKTFIN